MTQFSRSRDRLEKLAIMNKSERLRAALTLIREIAPSSAVLALTIAIPAVLLLLIWKEDLTKLPHLFSLANELKKYHEVLLCLIPLTIFGCAAGFVFAVEYNRQNSKLRPLFVPVFVLPNLLMLFCMITFLGCALNYRDEQLSDIACTAVNAGVVVSVAILFITDAFMAAARAEERARAALWVDQSKSPPTQKRARRSASSLSGRSNDGDASDAFGRASR